MEWDSKGQIMKESVTKIRVYCGKVTEGILYLAILQIWKSNYYRSRLFGFFLLSGLLLCCVWLFTENGFQFWLGLFSYFLVFF